MYNCTKLLVIMTLHLVSSESTICISSVLLTWILRGLSRIWLTFGKIHINSFPCIICILPINRLVYLLITITLSIITLLILIILLYHLCWSHTSTCCTDCVLVWSMGPNHLILRVLGGSMWANSWLDWMVRACVSMSDCHVHSILNILFSLLWKLRLVPHVVNTCLSESARHSHQLCLMPHCMTLAGFTSLASIVVMRWVISRVIHHLSWHLSLIWIGSSARYYSFVIIIRSII